MKFKNNFKVSFLRPFIFAAIACALIATYVFGFETFKRNAPQFVGSVLCEVESKLIDGIEEEKIVNDKARVSVSFPKTKNEEINNFIRDYINIQINDFQASSTRRRSAFYLWFDAYNLDSSVVSFVFHKNEMDDRSKEIEIDTMTWNIQTGKRYKITDLFKDENHYSVFNIELNDMECFVLTRGKLMIMDRTYPIDGQLGIKSEISLLELNEILSDEFKINFNQVVQEVDVSKLKDTKVIALTFDDGPYRILTPRLLDLLQEEDVRATFFVLGCMAEKNPDILKRIADGGHQIGNHTYSHKNLLKLKEEGRQKEINSAASIIKEITGHSPTVFRPPYGCFNDTIKKEAGMPLILWTIDVQDWRYRNHDSVYNGVVSQAENGSIVLLHDIYENTIEILGDVIKKLKEDGFEFVTIEELMFMGR